MQCLAWPSGALAAEEVGPTAGHAHSLARIPSSTWFCKVGSSHVPDCLKAHKSQLAAPVGGPLLESARFLAAVFTAILNLQVVLGVRAVDAVDYEVVTRHTRTAEDAVAVTQRVAGYLQPQQKNYFKAKGQAVYLRDSSWDMLRVPPPVDATGAAACVETPKGFTQCL